MWLQQVLWQSYDVSRNPMEKKSTESEFFSIRLLNEIKILLSQILRHESHCCMKGFKKGVTLILLHAFTFCQVPTSVQWNLTEIALPFLINSVTQGKTAQEMAKCVKLKRWQLLNFFFSHNRRNSPEDFEKQNKTNKMTSPSRECKDAMQISLFISFSHQTSDSTVCLYSCLNRCGPYSWWGWS